ncbi:MAG: S-layer homology domain-containing protein [Thiotrichaceae bacterium]|nr:S-layer homology domain-containing protein [Thiotrichaceae bacterium]
MKKQLSCFWTVFGVMLLVSLALITTQVKAICIGNEYEQQNPLPNVVLPSVQIASLPTKFVQGQAITLNTKATVDTQNGGYPFFVWCADSGTFAETADSVTNNYATVSFTPPNDASISQVKFLILVGDTLGYINVATVTIPVQPATATNTDPRLGTVTLTSNLPSINLSTAGTITLNGQPIQATWTPDGVTFNLYQATGTTFDSLSQPVRLNVRDANGQEIYVGCFPFKDVCPNQWATKPIIKLWKEGIIEGYNNGISATFGTNNDANRAEFTTALVRSLEQGKTPSPLTADPFADVSKDKWYAPEVQYAKTLGLIQGCDTTKNLFCPDKAITRAEASKVLVLAYPDLKQLAIDYQQGKAPNKVYSDVTDKQQWYYPYIYAVQAARIAQGYKDGTFQPGSALKRSEMAQMLCIAKFGVMACTDMGDTATKALVLTVSPYKAQLNQSTIFTVHGLNLAETMSLSIQDCSNITRLSHAADKQTYQCTPTLIGSKTAKMTDSTGKLLYSSTVQVEGVVAPVTLPGDTSTPPTNVVTPTTPPQNCTSSSVSSIDPSVFVRLGEEITFTVTGSCLSDKTALYLDECSSPNQGTSSVPQIVGGTAERRQFRCTPGYKATTHSGVVKDNNDGRELLKFNIDYRWGTPKVDSVTPSTVTSKQPTVFTITGASLLDTTAAWIKTCTGLQMFAGNANIRTFQCTPTDTGSMSIIIKAEPDVKAPDDTVITPGRELYNSTVTVQ